MPQRLPVDVVAEFRGLKPASQFTRRESGEVITVPAKLKFEYSWPNGDVMYVEVSGRTLDNMTPAIDYSGFARGDLFRLQGEAVIPERNEEGVYSGFRCHACEAVSAEDLAVVRPIAKAS